MNIFQWFLSLFAKKPTVQKVPIITTDLVGSPDYIQPPTTNPTMNWMPFISRPFKNQEEVLPNNSGDLLQEDCVDTGMTEMKEAILNIYPANGDLVDAFIIKNFDVNGQAKLSARYASKVADVQMTGISVQAAVNADAIYGIVPDSLWPTPAVPYTWNGYMNPILENIITFGKDTTTLFKFTWSCLWNGEWGVPNIVGIKEALKTSPVGFAGAIGNVDANGVEQWAGNKDYEHFRVIVSVNDDGTMNVVDNYPLNGTVANPTDAQLTRKLAADFPIPTAIVVALKII